MGNADVAVICFNVADPEAFERIDEWISRWERYSKEGAPYILCGTKIEKREEFDTQRLLESHIGQKAATTFKQANDFAVWGARDKGLLEPVTYCEVSAANGLGVKNVFDEALLAALDPPERRLKKPCCRGIRWFLYRWVFSATAGSVTSRGPRRGARTAHPACPQLRLLGVRRLLLRARGWFIHGCRKLAWRAGYQCEPPEPQCHFGSGRLCGRRIRRAVGPSNRGAPRQRALRTVLTPTRQT